MSKPKSQHDGEIHRRDLLRRATAMAGVAGAGLRAAQAQQAASGSADLFPGFKEAKVQISGATINVVSGGQGPPLLLHGHPQSHAEWHKVAPLFAKEFTVVAAD